MRETDSREVGIMAAAEPERLADAKKPENGHDGDDRQREVFNGIRQRGHVGQKLLEQGDSERFGALHHTPKADTHAAEHTQRIFGSHRVGNRPETRNVPEDSRHEREGPSLRSVAHRGGKRLLIVLKENTHTGRGNGGIRWFPLD